MKTIGLILTMFGSIAAGAQTARITFKAPVLYPEGIVYDQKDDRFFVSSVTTGTIGTVTREGVYKVFYEDSTMKSSFGMKTDGKKLWVCTGDPTYSKYGSPATKKKLIRLIGVDLASGKKTDDIDCSALINRNHFLNDLALDNEGNKYLTDSYSPVIYKIDSSGKAAIFVQDSLLKGKDVGLNGIVWDKKGFLLVANGSTGSVLKIDIASKKITPVKIAQFFSGADGLLWDQKGHLILVQNKGVNKIFILASSDEWQTATVVESTKGTDRFAQPSTATMDTKGKVYIMNSKLNELSDPTAPPSKEFSIQTAVFVPVK